MSQKSQWWQVSLDNFLNHKSYDLVSDEGLSSEQHFVWVRSFLSCWYLAAWWRVAIRLVLKWLRYAARGDSRLTTHPHPLWNHHGSKDRGRNIRAPENFPLGDPASDEVKFLPTVNECISSKLLKRLRWERALNKLPTQQTYFRLLGSQTYLPFSPAAWVDIIFFNLT